MKPTALQPVTRLTARPARYAMARPGRIAPLAVESMLRLESVRRDNEFLVGAVPSGARHDDLVIEHVLVRRELAALTPKSRLATRLLAEGFTQTEAARLLHVSAHSTAREMRTARQALYGIGPRSEVAA